MTEILNQVLPILILIAMGFVMRRVRFIGDQTVTDLRKVVVNPALPAVLFVAFLPPPFIIPLYMKEGIADERRYVNNTLSLYTLLSVGAFIVYLGVNPL